MWGLVTGPEFAILLLGLVGSAVFAAAAANVRRTRRRRRRRGGGGGDSPRS